MRITYDPEADAAYIYLTDEQLLPGRDSAPVDPPEGMQAWIVLDWKDGKMVGLEVLDAASLLHPDLLAQAIRLDRALGMQQAILTGPPPTIAVMERCSLRHEHRNAVCVKSGGCSAVSSCSA